MVEWWIGQQDGSAEWWPHTPLEYLPTAQYVARAIRLLGESDQATLYPALRARLCWFWSWLYLGGTWEGGKADREEPPTRSDIQAEREQWAHALRYASTATPELDDLLGRVRVLLDGAVFFFPKSEDEEKAA
jgi:hypothetical protein